MDLQNDFDVAASLDETWNAFLDMERIAPCMPGAEVTEVIDDRNVKGGAKVKVGPLNLRFAGSAEITEIDLENRTALVKAGGADAKGRGNADADIRFTMTEGGPSLTHVQVGTVLNLTGSVAQYGRASGLIDEIANQLIGEFVTNLEAELAVDADTSAAMRDAADVADLAATSSAPTGDHADVTDRTDLTHGATEPVAPSAGSAPASGLKLFFKAIVAMFKKRFGGA